MAARVRELRWRRFGRSTEDLIRAAKAAHALAQDACAASNQAKFAYTHLGLTVEGGILHVTADVAVFGSLIRSSNEPQVIVGITLDRDRAPPNLVAKCLARAECVKRFLRRFHVAGRLAARSVLAYFVSKLDAVARGSFLPPGVSAALHPAVNGMYRTMLALPSEPPQGVLYTPVQAGRWGAPLLSVRTKLNFLHGYLEASEGRNALVRRVLRGPLCLSLTMMPAWCSGCVRSLGCSGGWGRTHFQGGWGG